MGPGWLTRYTSVAVSAPGSVRSIRHSPRTDLVGALERARRVWLGAGSATQRPPYRSYEGFVFVVVKLRSRGLDRPGGPSVPGWFETPHAGPHRASGIRLTRLRCNGRKRPDRRRPRR